MNFLEYFLFRRFKEDGTGVCGTVLKNQQKGAKNNQLRAMS